MLAQLWREADDAARAAFRDLIDRQIDTGTWDSGLWARYRAAERIRDMVDEAIEQLQVADMTTTDPGDHFVYPPVIQQ